MGVTAQSRLVQGSAKLLVESGPHAGAQVTVAGQPCRVGRGGDNEVVLSDDLLASVHFMLDRHGDGFRLSALGGPVATRVGVLRAGQAASCADNESFQAGGTAFRFTAPAAPAAVRQRGAGRAGVAAGFAAGFTCALVLLAAVNVGAAAGPASPDMRVAAPAQTPAPIPAPRTATAVEVVRLMGDHLAAEGLGNVVLTAMADGSVEAAGEIMAQQLDEWRHAQRWFDAGFAGRTVLVDHVAMSPAAPPLAIQAAWPGPHPYVIDAGGQKLFAGAALRGGWTVERILADRVMIRRGAQTLAVRF